MATSYSTQVWLFGRCWRSALTLITESQRRICWRHWRMDSDYNNQSPSQLIFTVFLWNVRIYTLVKYRDILYIENRSQKKTLVICWLSQCSWENVHEFSDLVMYYFFLIQENVHECTKVSKICEHLLLRMIPNIWYIALFNSVKSPCTWVDGLHIQYRSVTNIV